MSMSTPSKARPLGSVRVGHRPTGVSVAAVEGEFGGEDGMDTADSNSFRGYYDVVPKIVESARRFDRRVVTAMRERPLLAISAALLTGYLLGRLVSRFG